MCFASEYCFGVFGKTSSFKASGFWLIGCAWHVAIRPVALWPQIPNNSFKRTAPPPLNSSVRLVMPSEHEIIEEFKQRRALIWASSKYWLLLAAIGFVGGAYIGNLDQNSSPGLWMWGVLFFAFIFVSILRLVFVVRANYRCPACGEIPMRRKAMFGPGSFGFQKGVEVSPIACTNCGARLK